MNNLLKRHLSQLGSSMVEILVSIGLMSTLGMMSMSTQKNTVDYQASLRAKMQAVNMVNEAYMVLKDPTVCECATNSLMGQTFNNVETYNTPGPDALDGITVACGAGESILNEGTFVDSARTLRIDEVYVRHNDTAGVRALDLVVRFADAGNRQGSLQSFERSFRLPVELTGNQVTGCFDIAKNMGRTFVSRSCVGLDGMVYDPATETCRQKKLPTEAAVANCVEDQHDAAGGGFVDGINAPVNNGDSYSYSCSQKKPAADPVVTTPCSPGKLQNADGGCINIDVPAEDTTLNYPNSCYANAGFQVYLDPTTREPRVRLQGAGSFGVRNCDWEDVDPSDPRTSRLDQQYDYSRIIKKTPENCNRCDGTNRDCDGVYYRFETRTRNPNHCGSFCNDPLIPYGTNPGLDFNPQINMSLAVEPCTVYSYICSSGNWTQTGTCTNNPALDPYCDGGVALDGSTSCCDKNPPEGTCQLPIPPRYLCTGGTWVPNGTCAPGSSDSPLCTAATAADGSDICCSSDPSSTVTCEAAATLDMYSCSYTSGWSSISNCSTETPDCSTTTVVPDGSTACCPSSPNPLKCPSSSPIKDYYRCEGGAGWVAGPSSPSCTPSTPDDARCTNSSIMAPFLSYSCCSGTPAANCENPSAAFSPYRCVGGAWVAGSMDCSSTTVNNLGCTSGPAGPSMTYCCDSVPTNPACAPSTTCTSMQLNANSGGGTGQALPAGNGDTIRINVRMASGSTDADCRNDTHVNGSSIGALGRNFDFTESGSVSLGMDPVNDIGPGGCNVVLTLTNLTTPSCGTQTRTVNVPKVGGPSGTTYTCQGTGTWSTLGQACSPLDSSCTSSASSVNPGGTKCCASAPSTKCNYSGFHWLCNNGSWIPQGTACTTGTTCSGATAGNGSTFCCPAPGPSNACSSIGSPTTTAPSTLLRYRCMGGSWGTPVGPCTTSSGAACFGGTQSAGQYLCCALPPSAGCAGATTTTTNLLKTQWECLAGGWANAGLCSSTAGSGYCSGPTTPSAPFMATACCSGTSRPTRNCGSAPTTTTTRVSARGTVWWCDGARRRWQNSFRGDTTCPSSQVPASPTTCSSFTNYSGGALLCCSGSSRPGNCLGVTPTTTRPPSGGGCTGSSNLALGCRCSVHTACSSGCCDFPRGGSQRVCRDDSTSGACAGAGSGPGGGG